MPITALILFSLKYFSQIKNKSINSSTNDKNSLLFNSIVGSEGFCGITISLR